MPDSPRQPSPQYRPGHVSRPVTISDFRHTSFGEKIDTPGLRGDGKRLQCLNRCTLSRAGKCYPRRSVTKRPQRSKKMPVEWVESDLGQADAPACQKEHKCSRTSGSMLWRLPEREMRGEQMQMHCNQPLPPHICVGPLKFGGPL